MIKNEEEVLVDGDPDEHYRFWSSHRRCVQCLHLDRGMLLNQHGPVQTDEPMDLDSTLFGCVALAISIYILSIRERESVDGGGCFVPVPLTRCFPPDYFPKQFLQKDTCLWYTTVSI
jgi:hypothetical protein